MARAISVGVKRDMSSSALSWWQQWQKVQFKANSKSGSINSYFGSIVVPR